MFSAGIILFAPATLVAWRSGLEHRFYDDHDGKVNGRLGAITELM